MKWKDSFHVYASITVLFWSLAYVLTRLALQYFSAEALGFLRYFTASCALIVVAAVSKMRLPRKQDILWFIAAGAMGFFVYMIAFNKGSSSVSAATGSIIIATVPVITALLARMIYGETLHGYQWASIAIEFAGVAVLTLLSGSFSFNSGLAWLFLAAITLSAYNLIQRKLTKTYSALQSATFSIFAGTAMLAIFLPAAVREVRQAPPIQFLYIGILGIFSSAIAYVCWSKAFSKAPKTSSVSNYMFVTPFLTTLLGFLLINEAPDPATMIGGAIILAGALLFNFGGHLFKKQH